MNMASAGFSVIGMIFLLAGGFLILLVLGISYYRKKFRESDDVIQTKAYVTEHIFSAQAGSALYYPVLRFKTEDGETLEKSATIGSMPKRVKENTYVTIYYKKTNPQKFHIDTNDWTFNFLTIFTVAGIFFAVIGYMIS